MTRRQADAAAAAQAIEKGDGCPALDNFIIPANTSTKEEWKALLQSVVDANKVHRTADPNTPELIIVTKPQLSGPGEAIGLTRKDLEDAGAPNRLVDRNYGRYEDKLKYPLTYNAQLPHSYDCSNLEEKYRHGNLPKLK